MKDPPTYRMEKKKKKYKRGGASLNVIKRRCGRRRTGIEETIEIVRSYEGNNATNVNCRRNT